MWNKVFEILGHLPYMESISKCYLLNLLSSIEEFKIMQNLVKMACASMRLC